MAAFTVSHRKGKSMEQMTLFEVAAVKYARVRTFAVSATRALA